MTAQTLEQSTSTEQKLNLKQVTDQRISIATKQELEQILTQDLATDIELEEDTLLIDELDQENIKEEEECNEEYGLPLDEYETGEKEYLYSDQSSYIQDIIQALEQFSIELCSGDMNKLNQFMEDIAFLREYGYLPEKSDEKLKAELLILENSFFYQRSSNYPVFRVIVENDRVYAYVISDINIRSKYRSNKHSVKINTFKKLMHDRQSLLENFAKILLEDLQRDFFLQNSFESALLNLIPIPPKEVDKLEIDSPFKLDKQYISKMKNLLIECDFGHLPLGLFMQEKAPIRNQWFEYANKNNVPKKKKNEWILNEIKNKMDRLNSTDKRYFFLEYLMNSFSDGKNNKQKKRCKIKIIIRDDFRDGIKHVLKQIMSENDFQFIDKIEKDSSLADQLMIDAPEVIVLDEDYLKNTFRASIIQLIKKIHKETKSRIIVFESENSKIQDDDDIRKLMFWNYYSRIKFREWSFRQYDDLYYELYDKDKTKEFFSEAADLIINMENDLMDLADDMYSKKINSYFRKIMTKKQNYIEQKLINIDICRDIIKRLDINLLKGSERYNEMDFTLIVDKKSFKSTSPWILADNKEKNQSKKEIYIGYEDNTRYSYESPLTLEKIQHIIDNIFSGPFLLFEDKTESFEEFKRIVDAISSTRDHEFVIFFGPLLEDTLLEKSFYCADHELNYVYIDKPYYSIEGKEELRNEIKQVVNNSIQKGLDQYDNFIGDIIGKSKALEKIIEEAKKAAKTDSNVLLLGERGTGKKLFAKLIHDSSKRKSKNFVLADVNRMSNNLAVNEMFGHEKGGYTGAHRDTKGLVGKADKGTLFIDEIGELSQENQAALLQLLEDKVVRGVGGAKSKTLDFKIISATNRNLEKAVEEGGFRSDLYDRISTICINLPPLNLDYS